MNQPKIGEAVFYCLDNGNNVGDARPAIIVRVWPDAQAVNLAVFTDFANDNLPTPYWATSRLQGTGPGHWAYTADGLVAPPASEVPLVPLVETAAPNPALAQPPVPAEPAPVPVTAVAEAPIAPAAETVAPAPAATTAKSAKAQKAAQAAAAAKAADEAAAAADAAAAKAEADAAAAEADVVAEESSPVLPQAQSTTSQPSEIRGAP
jgi:hypothetical protein